MTAYARNYDHPYTHRAIQGCGLCGLSQEERQAVIRIIPILLKLEEPWIQYQPRTSAEVAGKILPSACVEAETDWLRQAIGDALWNAGYYPDQGISPDPRWTWGGDLSD